MLVPAPFVIVARTSEIGTLTVHLLFTYLKVYVGVEPTDFELRLVFIAATILSYIVLAAPVGLLEP